LIETGTQIFVKEQPQSSHEGWQECAKNSKQIRKGQNHLQLKTKERHELKHPQKAVLKTQLKTNNPNVHQKTSIWNKQNKVGLTPPQIKTFVLKCK